MEQIIKIKKINTGFFVTNYFINILIGLVITAYELQCLKPLFKVFMHPRNEKITARDYWAGILIEFCDSITLQQISIFMIPVIVWVFFKLPLLCLGKIKENVKPKSREEKKIMADNLYQNIADRMGWKENIGAAFLNLTILLIYVAVLQGDFIFTDALSAQIFSLYFLLLSICVTCIDGMMIRCLLKLQRKKAYGREGQIKMTCKKLLITITKKFHQPTTVIRIKKLEKSDLTKNGSKFDEVFAECGQEKSSAVIPFPPSYFETNGKSSEMTFLPTGSKDHHPMTLPPGYYLQNSTFDNAKIDLNNVSHDFTPRGYSQDTNQALDNQQLLPNEFNQLNIFGNGTDHQNTQYSTVIYMPQESEFGPPPAYYQQNLDRAQLLENEEFIGT